MAIITARFQVDRRLLSITLLLLIVAMDTGLASFDSEMSVGRSTGVNSIGRGRTGLLSTEDLSSSEEEEDESAEEVTSTSDGMTPYERYVGEGRLWLRSRRQQWPPLVVPVKRGPDCMWKCLSQGYLHPAQCHSLC